MVHDLPAIEQLDEDLVMLSLSLYSYPTVVTHATWSSTSMCSSVGAITLPSST